MKTQKPPTYILKILVCVSFVLLIFSVPIGPGSAPRAQIDGECVMFCDDGGYSDSPTYDTGYGYGGGGCATYDQSAYYSGPTYVGEYHPDHSNVMWDGEYWTPAEGYEWVSDEQSDWRVQRIVGSYHSDHPNVVWNGEKWRPADGYVWYTDEPGDFRVIGVGGYHPYHANVVWNGEKWSPASGYTWANDIEGDFSVVGPGDDHPEHAHVFWNGTEWSPAEGYTWATTEAGNFNVIGPGDAYPGHPNVFWNGEKLTPVEGYVWLNDEGGDYRVKPAEDANQQPDQQSASLGTGDLPTDQGLRINEVPSPSGYRTAAERQVQLDRMSDEQIDTELKRIRQTLVRMKTDFDANTADLGEWLKEAEQAEVGALKDSFGLLVGGSLKRFEGVWENYPRLKAIAENGLDYAGKLDLAIKTSQDPTKIEYQLEIAREMMMDAHKAFVDEGVEALSESGPNALALTKFMVDYSYHMTRWGIARNQILAISDNLDKPNGALEAQKAIKKLQEELIHEQERRRTGAASTS